jgi:hypothetical protein
MSEDKPKDQVLVQTAPLTVQVSFGSPALTQRRNWCGSIFMRRPRSPAGFASSKPRMLKRDSAPLWTKSICTALPCAILAAAGVEAYANQIFADRAKIFAHFDQTLLEAMWKKWAERWSALEKLQFAYQIKGLAPLDMSAAPAQHVAALFALRNGLIHFKPEWSDARVEHEKLDKKLESLLFAVLSCRRTLVSVRLGDAREHEVGGAKRN